MMKNKAKIITAFLVLILLLSTSFVFADDELNPAETAVNSTENINSEEFSTNSIIQQDNNYKKNDVYLSGDDITVDYIVDGNLFICANNVTINSQIGGDAFIVTKNLKIEENGYIYNNLFTTAETVESKGVIYDVYAVAKNFTISGGYIYRDLRVCSENLNINSIIGRNVYASCSNINFNTDNENNALIYGNLEYRSKQEISNPENTVKGSVDFKVSESSANKSIGSIISEYIMDLGTFVTFVILIWLICLLLAPKFISDTNKYVGKKSLSVFGYGLLALLVVPVICIILILLQLTSSFSLLLLSIYIIAIVISKSLFTITANNFICSKLKINKNIGIFGTLIASSVVVWVINKIPYIGGIVSAIISILGLGILVLSILPERTKKNKVEENKTETLNNKE